MSAHAEERGMSERFFEDPILNNPYEKPQSHWELDEEGCPTQKIIKSRRESKLITPIPKQKIRGGNTCPEFI